MSQFSRSAGFPICAAMLCALFSAGCAALPPFAISGTNRDAVHREPSSSTPAAADGKAKTDADTTALRALLVRSEEKDAKGIAHSVWTHAVPPAADGFRWRYGNLDALLAENPKAREKLTTFLQESDPVCAANAAIGLAHIGDGRGAARLDAAVRAPQFAMAMRCAAIEALALVDTPAASKTLSDALSQYGGAIGKPGYLPELHAELLRCQASRTGAAGDLRFVAALKSPSSEVKLEAIAAMQSAGGPLPNEAADLRTHGDWRVRCAALKALAATRHAETESAALLGLRDTNLKVRLMAIECLGQIGGRGACDALKGLLVKTESDTVRMAAVSALAAAGERQAVLAAAGDPSWRVRQQAAVELGGLAGADSAAVASKLLSDPSAEVEHSVVTAVAQWPLELSGPILLDAMGRNASSVRKLAAESLAKQWPAAGEFPVDAPLERRKEAIAALESRLRGIVAPPATGAAPMPLAAADRKRLDEALQMLRAKDVQQRRRGADQLSVLAAQGAVAPPAMEQVAAVVIAESDALVWQSVLSAAAVSDAEPAARLACAALGHPATEVRRRACEYFVTHPDKNRAGAIVASLADENEGVVCAAAEALGAAGVQDAVAPLKRLLMARSELVCLAAGTALSRLGEPSGAATLERLSYSGDPHIQRNVALAMGSLGDRTFATSLVRLLDAEGGVQNAAIASLPKVVGRDISEQGEPPHGTADRIRRWKDWLAKGGGFDASAGGK